MRPRWRANFCPTACTLGKIARETRRDDIATIVTDIWYNYTAPEQAAETASDTKVGVCCRTALCPFAAQDAGKPFLGNARDIIGGALRVAKDGELVSRPTGSKEIRATRRYRYLGCRPLRAGTRRASFIGAAIAFGVAL